jgi:hypothetical protein
MSSLNPKPDSTPLDPWQQERFANAGFWKALPRLLDEIEKHVEGIRNQFPTVHVAWAETRQHLKELQAAHAEQDKRKQKSTRRRS